MKAKRTTDELIAIEARKLARETLERELASRDFPLPKDSVIETHLTQMIQRDPTFIERATALVEARSDAYTEGLKAIGMMPDIGPLNIQLKI